MGMVKVWIDGTGHYRRPEVLDFTVNRKPIWADDVDSADWPPGEDDQAARRKAKDVSRSQNSTAENGRPEADGKAA